jgi:hypothetical protein
MRYSEKPVIVQEHKPIMEAINNLVDMCNAAGLDINVVIVNRVIHEDEDSMEVNYSSAGNMAISGTPHCAEVTDALNDLIEILPKQPFDDLVERQLVAINSIYAKQHEYIKSRLN